MWYREGYEIIDFCMYLVNSLFLCCKSVCKELCVWNLNLMYCIGKNNGILVVRRIEFSFGFFIRVRIFIFRV